MADKPGMVTLKLTPEQARKVFMNADGWIDAGACKDGLEPIERAALHELCNQILRGLKRINPKRPLQGG